VRARAFLVLCSVKSLVEREDADLDFRPTRPDEHELFLATDDLIENSASGWKGHGSGDQAPLSVCGTGRCHFLKVHFPALGKAAITAHLKG